MPGIESQLLSHVAISMNVGVTAAQLREVALVLAEAGQADAAARTRAALEKHLAGTPR
jgi:4-carboxymuconolactone decarboxylase